ncbi:MAG: 2-iminobutanoate/2-iminopropanoate deaminase [Streptosporangiaceae bacterium]|nr:2-iminobutanoate/2-iminopropanoate deaminase [Streptosporangiaceae bacterium]
MARDNAAQHPDQPISISAVSTPHAPGPGGPYSQAVTAGDFVFLSGQRPVDAVTAVIPGNFAEQAHAVLRNLVQLAAAAGSSAGQVVKVTVHLADLKFFDEFNAVYQEYFTPPYPSRTTVGSQLRGILVEVDAIAVRHPRGTAQS